MTTLPARKRSDHPPRREQLAEAYKAMNIAATAETVGRLPKIRISAEDDLFWTLVRTELRMRQSPSIVPADRLDRDIYLVLEDFRNGAAWRETDESGTDFRTLINDLLSGQYDQPLRVVAFNPTEGWSRDASKEVAEELAHRSAEGEISEALQEFIESHIGRSIGVQLALL
jgi:hypothetical protein